MYKKILIGLALTFSLTIIMSTILFGIIGKDSTYEVSFSLNGGTELDSILVEEGLVLDIPDDPTKPTYFFVGWYLDEELSQPFDFTQDKVEKDLILYAKWDQGEQYTLTFDDLELDTLEFEIKDVYMYSQIGQLPTATKEGYSFISWKIDGQPINSHTFWEYEENKIAVADWELSIHTVTFDANGGIILGETQMTIEHESSLEIMPQEPLRESWVFEGWSSEYNGDVDLDENTLITGNQVWYAVWHFIDTYTQPLLMSDYFYNKSEKTNIETQFNDRDDFYYVGSQNPFIFAPEVRFIRNSDIIEQSGYESQIVIEIFDNGGFIELLGTNNYGGYVDIDYTKPSFNFDNSAIDNIFRITLLPAGFSLSELEDLYIDEIIFEFKVADAWNIHRIEDLSMIDNNLDGAWDDYKTLNNISTEPINGIILHKSLNIKPEHIPSSYLYSAQDEINDSSQVEGSLKDDVSIYTLVTSNETTFNFIGNYFTINASLVPLIQKGKLGGNSETGLISHATLFGFAGDDTNAPSNPERYIGEVHVKNTSFIGNANRSEDPELSGGFTLFRTTSEKFTMDNLLIRSTLTILVPLGEWVDVEGNNEIINEVYIINTKGYDSFSVMFYLWAADVVMIDSEFKRAGGPIVINTHRNNSTSRHESHYSTLKTYNTVLDNSVSGDEAWFNLNNASGIAVALKGVASSINNYSSALQDQGFVLDSTSLVETHGGAEIIALLGVIMTSNFPAHLGSPLLGDILINVDDDTNYNNYGADKTEVTYQTLHNLLPAQAPIFQSSNGGFAILDHNHDLNIFNGAGFVNIVTADSAELQANSQYIHDFFSGDYMTIYNESSNDYDSRMGVVLRFD